MTLSVKCNVKETELVWVKSHVHIVIVIRELIANKTTESELLLQNSHVSLRRILT